MVLFRPQQVISRATPLGVDAGCSAGKCTLSQTIGSPEFTGIQSTCQGIEAVKIRHSRTPEPNSQTPPYAQLRLLRVFQ